MTSKECVESASLCHINNRDNSVKHCRSDVAVAVCIDYTTQSGNRIVPTLAASGGTGVPAECSGPLILHWSVVVAWSS